MRLSGITAIVIASSLGCARAASDSERDSNPSPSLTDASPEQPSNSAVDDAASPTETRIGSSCDRNDPTVTNGRPDRLPPGVAYCLPPNSVSPYGYLTSNCATDTDCPGLSRCAGSLCRLPCVTDAECRYPTTCAPATPVSYCSCSDDCTHTSQFAGVPKQAGAECQQDDECESGSCYAPARFGQPVCMDGCIPAADTTLGCTNNDDCCEGICCADCQFQTGACIRPSDGSESAPPDPEGINPVP